MTDGIKDIKELKEFKNKLEHAILLVEKLKFDLNSLKEALDAKSNTKLADDSVEVKNE